MPPSSSTRSVESGGDAARELLEAGEVRDRSFGVSVVGSFRGFKEGSL